jgi:hypothetical protein
MPIRNAEHHKQTSSRLSKFARLTNMVNCYPTRGTPGTPVRISGPVQMSGLPPQDFTIFSAIYLVPYNLPGVSSGSVFFGYPVSFQLTDANTMVVVIPQLAKNQVCVKFVGGS